MQDLLNVIPSDSMSPVSAAIYLVAGVLFIQSLGGLSAQTTARRGNFFGMIGMVLAIGVTLWAAPSAQSLVTILVCLAVGCLIGATLAKRVAMTAMPELVAMLHSFVGVAAVLVGFSSFLDSPDVTAAAAATVEHFIHRTETFVGIFVGAVTFTGSLVAFAKLRELIGGKALLLPGRHVINSILVFLIAALGFLFVQDVDSYISMVYLLLVTGFASLLGIHLVLAIGGADMPVVVSMLNSYSGWAAAATGFLLDNDLLIITGALVGSSGFILSYIMCQAMNRSFANVIFGGIGTAKPVAAGSQPSAPAGSVQEITSAEVIAALKAAKQVVIVPGYGMAVAQAQYPVFALTQKLRALGINVRFAIHPVAGRLPGHMNVLLAEAKVPYDIVLEMDEINQDFPAADVVLVIGANDIVNPGALEDPNSPIAGMPVLECWNAKLTVVLKRGMAAGYAGIDNPLFYKPQTRMFFGDAKKSIDSLEQGI